MVSGKVNRACARCQRQKLKCDVERPCLLCTRAGVECVAGQDRAWVSHVVTGDSDRNGPGALGASGGKRRRSKRRSNDTRSDAPVKRQAHADSRGHIAAEKSAASPGLSGAGEPGEGYPGSKSSSTMQFVEEAFSQSDLPSPEVAQTSALRYGRAAVERALAQQNPSGMSHTPAPSVAFRTRRQRVPKSMVSELWSLFPDNTIVVLLVENYFAKIHWFILLFHQRSFKQSMHAICATGNPHELPHGALDDSTVGYMSVLLAVCALSLRYLSPAQQEQLTASGIDATSLREDILQVLKHRLLDILALGSLEAVQLCVLLGTYYLYHGEPELAWPLCGCGLRLAQALELHHRPSQTGNHLSQLQIEDRRRCWWAMHELETFCSMVYGFPLAIADSECDIEPLNPKDPCSIGADGQVSGTNQPTLLVYKCAMSALSAIIKSTLQSLYGTRQKQSATLPGARAEVESNGQIQLIEKVNSLNEQLKRWYADLPSQLRLERFPVDSPPGERRGKSASSPKDLSFDQKLFQLQSLSLKLAFENTRILIHRPLLSLRVYRQQMGVDRDESSAAEEPDTSSVFVNTCLDAALQISLAGHIPIFKEATSTYALNSIALHLLTAGVVLCIVASSTPLSDSSLQAKLGIRRLMEMQFSLKADSIMADQGLQILRKLLTIAMQKETNYIFKLSPLDPPGLGDEANTRESVENLTTACNATTNNHNASQPPPNPASRLGSSLETFNSGVNWSNGTAALPLPTSVSICENIPVAQTMLDIEQAFMSQSHHPSLIGDSDSNIPETYMHSTMGQDQGWIWDPQLGFGPFE